MRIKGETSECAKCGFVTHSYDDAEKHWKDSHNDKVEMK